MKKILESLTLRRIAKAVCILIVVLLVFHAGVVVGSHRAFDRSGMGHGFQPAFFPRGFEMPHSFIQDGHGAVGTITTFTPPTFIMKTRDGETESVTFGTSTIIRNMSAPEEGTSTLSVGDRVTVLGEPDTQNNRIDARVIRIIPIQPHTP